MRQEDKTTSRKGPWTEHEDFQLLFHVHMFGDRRWDFIANVSGLKRSGKSCRLRWVNYLNPGLKRGKLAPHEERIVLELHTKFGNRWSKIARKLPGRTDNEIKNYWRTHMRKRAQEKKRIALVSQCPTLSNCSSSSSICSSYPTVVGSMSMTHETKERSFYDTGGVKMMFTNMEGKKDNKKHDTKRVISDSSEGQDENYSMDDIWKDIDLLDENSTSVKSFFEPYGKRAPLTWDICMSTSWTTDGQEEFTNTTFHLASQQFRSELVD